MTQHKHVYLNKFENTIQVFDLKYQIHTKVISRYFPQKFPPFPEFPKWFRSIELSEEFGRVKISDLTYPGSLISEAAWFIASANKNHWPSENLKPAQEAIPVAKYG